MAKVAAPPAKGAQRDWFLEEEEEEERKRAAASRAASTGKPLSDPKLEAQRLNDESSASLQRSLAMVHQSEAIAEDTIIELDKQGRQIERMERDMETVEDNNRQADRHVRSLKSVFGRIANKFSKNTSYREESEVKPREATASALAAKGGSSQRNLSTPAVTTAPSNAELIQGNGAEEERLRQQIRQQDQDLDQIGAALGRMHNMALDMNVEIKDQNQRLDGLSNKVVQENRHLEDNSRKVKKML